GLAGSGPYVAPRVNTSSAKGMAGLGLLTKVWSGWGRDASGADGEIRQRTRVELRGPSGAGLLRAWIPSNHSALVLQQWNAVREGRNVNGGEETSGGATHRR